MAVRLFVGNLPYDATEAELREHFSAVSPPSYIYLPVDRESGRPRGFAFVEFSDAQQAQEAIRRFNNQLFRGRPISINEARAKGEAPRAAPARPPRTAYAPPPDASDAPARAEKAGRSFGTDAPSRRTRTKEKRGGKQERVPKGPMREMVSSRFFGGDDDDETVDDDLNDENFASRVDTSDDEKNE